VQHLVLDEADRLLGDPKFIGQVDEIIASCTNKDIQRSLWSATMLPAVEELAKTFLKDPLQLFIGTRNAANTVIDQKLVFVGREQGKLLALRRIIQEGIKPPVLIFVQSKERASELFHELIYDGINVDVITADRTQPQREAIIDSFRQGRIWVLIATDLMARGMYIQGISMVINYDFPQSTRDYIHRIGRTGRAGRGGSAVTFYAEEDVEMLRSIANVMRASGCDVPEWALRLDKISKPKRKKLERKPIDRPHIKTVTKYDLKENRKQRNLKIKQRKRTGGGRYEKLHHV